MLTENSDLGIGELDFKFSFGYDQKVAVKMIYQTVINFIMAIHSNYLHTCGQKMQNMAYLLSLNLIKNKNHR